MHKDHQTSSVLSDNRPVNSNASLNNEISGVLVLSSHISVQVTNLIA